MDLQSNYVHATAIVESEHIGQGNFFGPYTYIGPDVVIGNNNIFQAYCSIGMPPEHRQAWDTGERKPVRIGDRNRFNEFVTINCGWQDETTIGNDCYFLRGSHVGHCAQIANEVRVHCNVIIGGHVVVRQQAYLGLGCIINPKLTVGHGALLGSGAVLTKSALSFKKYAGVPAKVIGENTPR